MGYLFGMADELGAHADAARAREELLVQRLGASTHADEAFVATLRDAQRMNMLGRQRLDGIRAELEQAVANQQSGALGTPAGARQLQRFLADKTRDINKVVVDAAADSAKKAELVQSLGKYYTAGFGRDLPAAPATTPADDEPPKRMSENPKEFRDFWDRLTPAEKDRLYQQDHSIGNHPGMPFTDRDHYNRMHLSELQKDRQDEIDRLRARHSDWADGKTPFLASKEYSDWKKQWDAANHARDGYARVQDTLGPPPDKLDPSSGQLPRYLAIIDDKGHAAVSINNPDTAKRNATFVPGTGQDLARFDVSADKSKAMLEATMKADRSLRPGDVSVTTWMGYDRPMNLVEAAHTGYAHNGAAALDDFQAGLRASHNDALAGGPSLNTVIGHSYGSTEVGAAALDGHHLDANNVIAVGSPGMFADHASDLNLDPGAHVFSTRAYNDVIGVVTGMTLGPDPMLSSFGGVPFEAAPGPAGPLGLPTVGAHSSYWDNMDNPALINMGRIIAGRTDVTPPTFTP